MPVNNVQDKGAKECMPCVLSPLGYHLNAASKERIWSGDYVDLSTVLPPARDFPNSYDKKDE